jgi:cobalt-zinc-cadmium efflux system membrane fusion protein
LFTVGDPNALWITADVFAADLPSIKEGAQVEVDVASLDEPLHGKVARVSSALDPQTRRGSVFITLDNSDAKLRAGMLARAGIQIQGTAGLTVPLGAVLIKDGDTSIVFVQTEETVFEARKVVLGSPSGGHIPVLSGLNPGDKVVVRGALLLDGSASQLL